MPFDNDLSAAEMASLVALRRLVEIDSGMVNSGRVIAEFHSHRGARLARAIVEHAVPASEEDVAALAMITKVAVV